MHPSRSNVAKIIEDVPVHILNMGQSSQTQNGSSIASASRPSSNVSISHKLVEWREVVAHDRKLNTFRCMVCDKVTHSLEI